MGMAEMLDMEAEALVELVGAGPTLEYLPAIALV